MGGGEDDRALDPPVTDSHGNEITERVASVTYRPTPRSPTGYRDAFELSLQLPEPKGATLVFPTIQTCEQGESAWIEVPADGQSEEELELPAPAFVVTAADGGGHDTPSAVDAEPRPQRAGRCRGRVERRDAWTIAALGRGRAGAALGGDGARAPASPDMTGRRSPAGRLLLLVGRRRAAARDGSPGERARHADRHRSRPRARSSTAAPEQVRFTFDEAVVAVPDGVQVFDARGVPSRLRRRSAGPSCAVALTEPVGHGTLVVVWRVVSEDGHPISGSLTFSVGAPAPTSRPRPRARRARPTAPRP